MLALVTPHLYVASVLELGHARLRELGVDGLLLDLDCTLKDYRCDDFPARVVAWASALRAADIGLCIVSNGGRGRVEGLARKLGIPSVARAFKPLPFACAVASRRLGLDRSRVALVGDQLFADILAGRLAGLLAILVHPTSPEEPWFTRLKRALERRILRSMAARRPSSRWPGPRR